MKKTEFKLTEAQIQRQILEWAGYLGLRLWRFNSGMIALGEATNKRIIRLGQAGTPDLIGYFTKRFANGKWAGKFIAIEVKAGKNKPSDIQKRTLDEIEKDGALVLVAYSLKDVKRFIGKMEG